MKFSYTKVDGFEAAIIGLRLPMCKDFEEAKEKSDSGWVYTDNVGEEWKYVIGKDDLRIAKNLIKADCNSSSQPNSKFLRMIHAQVAITAPLYFYKELDTYKVATVANSTSTMHKLASTPITIDCFEMGDFIQRDTSFATDNIHHIWNEIIIHLENIRKTYLETKDKRYWEELIRLLPESWLQTRMFDCDYATLRNIYKWRHNHKLTEWHKFCEWIKTLPYADDLIFDEVSE